MKTCPYCGYDFEGLDNLERCPECGHIVSEAYIQSLMRHRVHRDELLLYRIACLGWWLHLVGFLVLAMQTGANLFCAAGAMIALAFGFLSIHLSWRARKTWPRRFIRYQGEIDGYSPAPRGFVLAMAAWLSMALLVCGLLL